MEATVKLDAPSGADCVSVDGEEYRVDRGVVEVPASAAERLRSHGYLPHVPKAAPVTAKKASDKAPSNGSI
jgi:hypothetical protein